MEEEGDNKTSKREGSDSRRSRGRDEAGASRKEGRAKAVRGSAYLPGRGATETGEAAEVAK